MSSYNRIQLEKWLKTIDVAGSCLDIGGSQNPIEERTKSWNCDNYKILDLKQPHECKREPDITWDINERPITGLRFEKEFDKITNKDYQIIPFDNIFFIEVSEYIWNPIDVLRNIHDLLKKDGLFYSSWHFIHPQHPPIGLDYLRYTSAGVEKLLKETDFEILEDISRRTQLIDLRELWASEQMKGWKEFDNTIIGSLIKAKKN